MWLTNNQKLRRVRFDALLERSDDECYADDDFARYRGTSACAGRRKSGQGPNSSRLISLGTIIELNMGERMSQIGRQRFVLRSLGSTWGLVIGFGDWLKTGCAE
jgi:hypothetical protein